MRGRDTTADGHLAEVRTVHERALADTSVRSRFIEVDGRRVHVLQAGAGLPLVLLHGTNSSALFLLPLLSHLHDVAVTAADRPGQGRSEPGDLPDDGYRRAAVAWVDHLLDTLELESAAVAGHSAGALWALWYALAHPERVRRLVVIDPPAFPETRVPIPLRLASTPGIGGLLRRIPPTPQSMRRFARFMGEQTTIDRHPHTVDLMVVAARDPVAAAADQAELRVIVSPFALLSRSGFRRRTRVRAEDLRGLTVPTLVLRGQHDPVGGLAAGRVASELIPDARLEMLPTGHAPFLGHPEQTAAIVADFVQTERIISPDVRTSS